MKFDDIFKRIEIQGLSKEEKAQIRASLVSQISESQEGSPVSSSFYSMFVFMRGTAAAFLFTLIILGGGATSLVAESTIPGDFLYSFKRNINEEVRGWFANSQDEKLEWQLTLADRRLTEVDYLAKENRLTEENRESLKQEYSAHTKRAQESAGIEEEAQPMIMMQAAMPASEENFSDRAMKASFVPEEVPAPAEQEEGEKLEAQDWESRLSLLEEKIKELRRGFDKQKEKASRAQKVKFFTVLLQAKEMLIDSRLEDDKSGLLEAAEANLASAEALLYEVELQEKVSVRGAENTAAALKPQSEEKEWENEKGRKED